MARTNNLTNFLTDVADAIRTKTGGSAQITAANFDTEIGNIPSGGGADLSEYFNNSISQNPSSSGGIKLIKKYPDMLVSDNVTSLAYLFYNYVSSEDTIPRVVCNDNVISMSYMYSKDTTEATTNPLKTIDCSGLDTTNVTNMSFMFKNRASLTSLDLSNFVGESLITAQQMFYECARLAKLDLSNFNPTIGIGAGGMFQKCYYLEELDLDSWDLTNTDSFGGMFSNCGTDIGLTKVYVKDADAQNWVLTASNGHPSTWSTDNVIIAGSEADLRNA